MTLAGVFGATSCSDMLETDSDRQLIDPSISQKTDSIFYAFGVLQAVQQVADQYVFTGEMRGDLVKVNDHTDNNLRQLYEYSDTAGCKYDSAYAYYRIINNCNYYIAHRDTSLLTGSTQVAMPEYAAIKAFRAWAYLQLVRNYKSVPFFTQPLTTISQINETRFDTKDISGVVAALAPDLEQYVDMSVPTSGITNQAIGSTNFGTAKQLTASKQYVPVALVLGDLYLEDGQYAKAAAAYARYLINNEVRCTPQLASEHSRNTLAASTVEMPQGATIDITGATNWSGRYSANNQTDLITAITMPVNSRQGVTTVVPEAFGYNYYGTRSDYVLDQPQILPSSALRNLSSSQDVYYKMRGGEDNVLYYIKAGDRRLYNYLSQTAGLTEMSDTTKWWMNKYTYGNMYLYRQTTVYLHLAEALNRMGYPDAAFAILKDGISDRLLESTITYIGDSTRQMLQTTVPLLSATNRYKFSTTYEDGGLSKTRSFAGIHSYGTGYAFDGNYPGCSPYQMDTIVVNKVKELAEKFPGRVTVPETENGTVAEIMAKLSTAEIQNAVEDLICDEYALEAAFEGTRFPDLLRMTRHKNKAGIYGASFGTEWLVNKLSIDGRDASVLYNENRWYLPFQ